MARNQASPDAEVFVEEIDAAEQHVSAYALFLKRLKSRLSRAKTTLTSKAHVVSQVGTLVSDLQRMKPEPEAPAVSKLVRSLERHLKSLRYRLQESLPADLRRGCETAHLEFAALPDGFAVGPFFVTVNRQKETASFQYAKVDIVKDVPLSVKAIIHQANSSRNSLLDQPLDLAKLATELHEAMRVALARQNKTAKTELRVELPAIFREMMLIRQLSSTKRKSAKREYSVPRFVVEVKQFIQSDQNVKADRQFHLETAVIENTKNPRKSVFIPRDLSRGFGEGTYYQAIVLRYD